MGDRYTLSLRAYRWVAYAALVTLVLIVFSGAGVRLTGSGLGCPTWPDCSGTFVPALDTHVWIEYGNRLFSTVVGIACIAAGVLAFRVRPLRRDLLRPAAVLAGGVIAQGLVAGTRVLVVYGAVVIVAGTFATAAGPHAGGAGTGDVVERLDAFGAETLRSLIFLHGHMATAMGIVAVLLWGLARYRRAGPELMRPLTAVCVLMAAQGGVGLIQYHNPLPAEGVWG